MSEPGYPDALPAQFRLHWYVVERVLGQGGFGITYLARDSNLDQPIAIKEYLPVDVATRRPDATVRSRTEESRERYRWGLDRFIKEARMLARFDHPNIVRVHSVFELNNTAYMVMRFEPGDNLSAVLESRGALAEDELLRILLPVLDGLALVHEAGFIHRDIKPDNIHIRADGSPVLLDFGSARSALGKAHTLTILVAPGYAPFEQYYSSSESQGPWTDIYGLGATCYRSIAGRAPLDAIARSKGILGSTRDVMVPAAVVGAGRYSGRLLAAIDHALAFGEKERPQSVAEWRRELVGDTEPARTAPARPEPAVTRAATTIASPPAAPAPVAATARTRGEAPRWSGARGPIVWSIAGAAVALVVIGTALYQGRADRTAPSPPVVAPKADPAADVREKLSALEKQVAEERQRAERERKQREAADEARAKQEAEAKSAAVRPAEKKSAAKPEPAPRIETPPRRAAPPPIPATRPEPPPAAVPQPPADPPAPRPPAQLLADADRAIAGGNYADAVGPLNQLVAANNAGAQFRLGNLYLQGRGVPRSDEEAQRLLRLAADQGHAQAQLAMGSLYAAGRGVSRSDGAAATWYRRAADQGESDAQASLADAFAAGLGVPVNNFQAYVWYSLAARAGNARGRVGRDKVAALLQPAEIRQADALVENWKPGATGSR